MGVTIFQSIQDNSSFLILVTHVIEKSLYWSLNLIVFHPRCFLSLHNKNIGSQGETVFQFQFPELIYLVDGKWKSCDGIFMNLFYSLQSWRIISCVGICLQTLVYETSALKKSKNNLCFHGCETKHTLIHSRWEC